MRDSSASAFVEAPTIAHFDWRHQAVTTTTAAAGGFPAGSTVMAIAVPVFDHTRTLRFGLPSTTALMLSFSQKMFNESQDILTLFQTQGQTATLVGIDDPKLFDLVEKRMASVLFSYTALEAFANEQIAYCYGKGYVYNKEIKGVEVQLTLEDVERVLPLGEKLNDILPAALEVNKIKGGVLWSRFRTLETLRHRIVHNKEIDRISRSKRDDGATLWAQLTNQKYRNFPQDSYDVMLHFLNGRGYRWLEKATFTRK